MKLLPSKRAPRIATLTVIVLGYAAILWFFVFPWLDRTFVNRPALG
jgi:quinol-cytochrome oxidoreductase complex cytochrome b subunit